MRLLKARAVSPSAWQKNQLESTVGKIWFFGKKEKKERKREKMGQREGGEGI